MSETQNLENVKTTLDSEASIQQGSPDTINHPLDSKKEHSSNNSLVEESKSETLPADLGSSQSLENKSTSSSASHDIIEIIDEEQSSLFVDEKSCHRVEQSVEGTRARYARNDQQMANLETHERCTRDNHHMTDLDSDNKSLDINDPSWLQRNTDNEACIQQLTIEVKHNDHHSIGARQIVGLVGVASTTICFSLLISWAAVLPKIEEDPTSFTITKEDIAWLVSITSMAGVIAALFAGSLMELLGPRRLIILAIFPMAGLWLMMAFTPYLSLLYVGRVGLAICCCCTNTCTQPLVAELCPPRIRGIISSSSEIVSAGGICIGYILAHTLSWQAATAVSAIPAAILFMIFVCVVPESPYWLLRHNKRHEAQRSLELMLGKGKQVTEQLDIMESSTTTNGSLKKQIYLLRKREYAVPVLLVWTLFVLREFGGKTTISSYSVYMFRQAQVEIDPFVCTILLGVIRVVGHVISALTMDRFGRKPFLIISSLICGAALVISGIFLWLELPGRSWVCLVLLMMFIVAFGLGVGPIPWMYLGEMIPTPVRPLGASFTILTYNSAGFIVNYVFFTMVSQFGLGLTMAFLSIPNFLILAITVVWLPETQGQTLEDLEKTFRKRM